MDELKPVVSPMEAKVACFTIFKVSFGSFALIVSNSYSDDPAW